MKKAPIVPHQKGLTEEERFNRIGWTVLESGCWEWRGYVSPKGYGRFNHKAGNLAHRFSLSLKLGRLVGNGLSVLHSCDNPRCVNPDHLSEGNHFDNMSEAASKLRFSHAKLNPDNVLEIYKRSQTEGTYKLSKEFGVVPAAIRAIRDGRNWKWLTQQGD